MYLIFLNYFILSLFQQEENNNNKKLCEREKIYHFRVMGCKIKNRMWGLFLKWYLKINKMCFGSAKYIYF